MRHQSPSPIPAHVVRINFLVKRPIRNFPHGLFCEGYRQKPCALTYSVCHVFFAVVATAIFTLFLLVLSTAANLLFVSENF